MGYIDEKEHTEIVHQILELERDRDRLREVVREQADALEGLFADGDYCMPDDTPIVVDSAAKALRAALEEE